MTIFMMIFSILDGKYENVVSHNDERSRNYTDNRVLLQLKWEFVVLHTTPPIFDKFSVHTLR